jgi:hypothetical protein
MFRSYVLTLVFVVPAVLARAQVVSYEATSFPEEEGWTRDTFCDPERWIDDGWLFQHVEPPDGPCGDPPHGDRDSYSRSISDFDGQARFFVEWRVYADGDRSEIIGSAPALLSAWSYHIAGYRFVMARDQVRFVRNNPIDLVLYVDIEPSVLHTYRLELYGEDQPYVWYIDTEIAHTDMPAGAYPAYNPGINWRAKSWYLESTVQWDYIRYGTIPEPGSGDYDGDGLVGPSDFYYFQDYFSGSNRPALPGGAFADFDFDGDVDCDDWEAFELTWTGPPEVPEFPPCNFDPIPAVSDWGVVLMTLLLLTAGTILFRRVPPLSA